MPKSSPLATVYTDVETDHEYDGIREFDNPLPRWWLVTFWGSIVFAVVYWAGYHTTHVWESEADAYAAVVADWEAEQLAKTITDEELVALAADAGAIERGDALFQTNCAACHEAKGEGKIGPNLTDNLWLRGGSGKDIFKVIAMGSLTKGMPAWRPVLGDTKVREVTAFVLSLRNTNIVGKAPEGEPYTGTD